MNSNNIEDKFLTYLEEVIKNSKESVFYQPKDELQIKLLEQVIDRYIQFKAQEQYEGYEDWNDERDCLKSEIHGLNHVIKELKEDLKKAQEQKLLMDFCHFLGNEGYHINGYDDGMLLTIINRFKQQHEQ